MTTVLGWMQLVLLLVARCTTGQRLYHVAIPTDVSLLSLSRRQSAAQTIMLLLTGDTRKIFVSRPRRRVQLGARLDRL